jgi:hypothetical protein
MKINEKRLSQIIREAIDDVIEFGETKPTPSNMGGGSVGEPYDERQTAINRAAIGNVGNPSWNAFEKWREEGLRMGRPSKELNFANFKKEGGFSIW